MEYNLFIIPITLIVVELLKLLDKIPKQFLPWLAVGVGAISGLLFGLYYQVDLFEHIFLGIVYGASASGIYDVKKSSTPEK